MEYSSSLHVALVDDGERQSSRPRRISCVALSGLLALAGVAALQVAVLVGQAHTAAALVEMQNAMQQQPSWGEIQSAMQQQRSPQPQSTLKLTEKLAVSSSSLPHRFLVSDLTPSADQMNRGDCWLFSATGILEDSYQRYGVKQGWFPHGKYLRLSRQALGIAVMETCRKSPMNACPANDMPDGTISWGNTTEGADGADEHIIAYMKELGDIGAVPNSVCAYSPTAEWQKEHACPGLADARKKNPLRFNVKGMKSYYTREDVKAALINRNEPLTMGVRMVMAPFLVPCDGHGCDPNTAKCVACPLERAYANVKCCVKVDKPMVSMNGEWFINENMPLVQEGGHAVNIVGYNDRYVDEWGNVGGYILRNTWADGLSTAHGLYARGSHSANYYAQQIGPSDDHITCPNPHSPRSWSTCASLDTCFTPVQNMEQAMYDSVKALRCIDLGFSLPKGACEQETVYYLANMTAFANDGLFISCFLFNSSRGNGSRCYPPLTIDDLALIFTPADLDRRPVNNKNVCGYNFLPYKVYETLQAKLYGVASSYDIEWTMSSYSLHPDEDADYSSIDANTFDLEKTQMTQPIWLSA